MSTSDAQRAVDAKARLARNKTIDAICDGFEEAWGQENQPRIEDYLAHVTDVDRADLFRELLTSELALRGPAEAKLCRDAYLQRFPEYCECVSATFASLSTEHLARESRRGNEDFERLIETTRRRLRRKDTVVAGFVAQEPSALAPAGFNPSSEQLWKAMIEAASITESSRGASINSSENVDRLLEFAVKLLDAFSTLRRCILVSMLLGETIEQIAEGHRCTERTVDTTGQAALDLLGPRRVA
ncbi:MAG TPA: hypothetical protein VHX65_08950 [Pirellulales bacterium]|jgi:hypothetical protein|nr:hypothetical protein [Pirellulales bacterium]